MRSVAPDSLSSSCRSLSVSPAERENGISAKYAVRWKGIGHRRGLAEDVSGGLLFVKVPEGWLAGAGGFPNENDFVGRIGYLIDDDGNLIGDGDYAGTFAAHLRTYVTAEDCALHLRRGARGAFRGSYAFRALSGSSNRGSFSGDVVALVHPLPRTELWTRMSYGHDWHMATRPHDTRGVLLMRDADKRLRLLDVRFHDDTGTFEMMWEAWQPENVLQFARETAPSPATDTSSVATTVARATATVPASVAPTRTAVDDLPGRPYPNPPPDIEALEAISSFLGEVQEGGHRSIHILGYRQMCAQPVGPECHVLINGKLRRVFTLTRTADGRLEATDLGSCGD
jgi:hypothetical protein